MGKSVEKKLRHTEKKKSERASEPNSPFYIRKWSATENEMEEVRSFVAFHRRSKPRRSPRAYKTVNYTITGIRQLPEEKPVTYQIKTATGRTNYIGTAQERTVRERVMMHLNKGKGYIPGAKVEIEQHSSIDEAQKRKAEIINSIRPKYNN